MYLYLCMHSTKTTKLEQYMYMNMQACDVDKSVDISIERERECLLVADIHSKRFQAIPLANYPTNSTFIGSY